MMDVQIIAGLCPKAEISVYFSTFDQGGWVDTLNAVIAAKPAVLSVSWDWRKMTLVGPRVRSQPSTIG